MTDPSASPSCPSRIGWVGRSMGAGLLAAFVGVGYGTSTYLRIPGVIDMDWALMAPIVVSYGLLVSVLCGLGLGGGMIVVARRAGGRPTFGRVMAGAICGGVLGAIIPGVVGIAGFGSIRAPYMGSENTVASVLLATAVFVAFFGPALSPRGTTVPLLRRLAAASVASVASAATVGGLGWLLAVRLELVPTLDWLQVQTQAMGLLSVSLVGSVFLGLMVGVLVGFASWIYSSLAPLLVGASSSRASS